MTTVVTTVVWFPAGHRRTQQPRRLRPHTHRYAGLVGRVAAVTATLVALGAAAFAAGTVIAEVITKTLPHR